MKTFFDANLLLEILLPRRPREVAAAKALRAGEQHTISPLTVHLYVHFGLKQRFPLKQLLFNVTQYLVTDFGSAEIKWAIQHCQDNDFEDALQVACAILGGCTEFITFDKKLALHYGQFIDMKLL